MSFSINTELSGLVDVLLDHNSSEDISKGNKPYIFRPRPRNPDGPGTLCGTAYGSATYGEILSKIKKGVWSYIPGAC